MRKLAVVSLIGLGLVARAGIAQANEYEEFIDIDDQADLDDLLASGDISQDTYDEILDLLETGVDLSKADRAKLYALPNLTYDDVDGIIAFREKQNGVIADPAALVTAGVLTQDKLLGMSAFLIVTSQKPGFHLRGTLKAQARYTIRDKHPPPLLLRGRFALSKHLTAGFAATLTRLQVGDPSYDPNRDTLIADDRGIRPKFPKIYLKYSDDKVAAVAGSFRVGFGQRLVFDTSRQYTPNGIDGDDQMYYSADLDRDCRQSTGELDDSPCAGDAAFRYTTPDYQWRDGLFGLAGGIKKAVLGAGWLQAYAWASVTDKRIYQYELVDAGRCADPHDDNADECAAPPVIVRNPDDPLAASPRFAFVTLPNVFQERLAGANASYFADRRNSVGITAYAAGEHNLVDGVDLGTQEWSRLPLGTADSGAGGALDFGAVGVNFTFGRNWLDVAGEGAFSFDHLADGPGPQAGGGGPAGILRVTATQHKQELEATFRYYSVDYANPFARPISQADEFDGQRARDESGFRLRYTGGTKRYKVRALVDLWAPVSSFSDDAPLGRWQPKLDSYLRADVRTSQELWLGLYFRYQDKDLKEGGHDQCFEVVTETSETGEPVPCSGRQLTSIARARYVATRDLTFTGLLQHQLLDDNAGTRFDGKFRQDFSAWIIGQWHAADRVRVRGRLRYFDEAFNDGDDLYLERSLTGRADVLVGLRKKDAIGFRVDTKFWLDARDSTASRDPNPELQLWLSYEARL